MTRYRFTIRPASSYHCPDGWTEIVPLIPDRQWNYGTVDYPEPLAYEVAQHWSLDPDSGPRVSEVSVDGDPTPFDSAFHDGARLRYDLAVGAIAPDDLRRLADAKGDEYEVDIAIAINENVEGASLPLWRDA